MRATSANRLLISEAADFFGPRELARILGIAEAKAYELVRQRGFPARRIGKRWLISKTAFEQWAASFWQ